MQVLASRPGATQEQLVSGKSHAVFRRAVRISLGQLAGALLTTLTMGMLGAFGPSAPAAHAAGIVTHAWMGLDAIDHVDVVALRALLEAHRDQVRAGAEFPDGGYWTRDLGTPGGDYGEEAHWQRFI